jgi:hypothetical protein
VRNFSGTSLGFTIKKFKKILDQLLGFEEALEV